MFNGGGADPEQFHQFIASTTRTTLPLSLPLTRPLNHHHHPNFISSFDPQQLSSHHHQLFQSQLLEKYTGKVREGMILGLEVAFTKLCEEIKNLVDLQSFWHESDGFNEQLSQLKEMGYNVEKVSGRIDILKGIGDRERASRVAAEKFENEVRDREANLTHNNSQQQPWIQL